MKHEKMYCCAICDKRIRETNLDSSPDRCKNEFCPACLLKLSERINDHILTPAYFIDWAWDNKLKALLVLKSMGFCFCTLNHFNKFDQEIKWIIREIMAEKFMKELSETMLEEQN